MAIRLNYIAREGWPFIGAVLAIAIAAAAIGFEWLAGLSAAAAIFLAFFYRDPERVAPTGDDVVVSPADGKVIAAGDGKVSIFMSVFNVHINRVPISGCVKKIVYNKGKFHVASRDKASLENEQNKVVVASDKGEEITFVQIAGIVARRIVCHLKEGMKVTKGRRFGMIHFGSRVDVYLPEGFEVKVVEGEKVRGGTSVIAVRKRG